MTAAGPTSDMWAYNLVTQTWQIVAPSAPAPGPNTDVVLGVGLVIGRQ